VAGDHHLLTGLDGANEFGQAVLRFCGADVHIENYSYKLWL
jgi:hypothetical protein